MGGVDVPAGLSKDEQLDILNEEARMAKERDEEQRAFLERSEEMRVARERAERTQLQQEEAARKRKLEDLESEGADVASAMTNATDTDQRLASMYGALGSAGRPE